MKKVCPVQIAFNFVQDGFSVMYCDTDLDRLRLAKEKGLETTNCSYLHIMASYHHDIVIGVNPDLFIPHRKDWIVEGYQVIKIYC